MTSGWLLLLLTGSPAWPPLPVSLWQRFASEAQIFRLQHASTKHETPTAAPHPEANQPAQVRRHRFVELLRKVARVKYVGFLFCAEAATFSRPRRRIRLASEEGAMKNENKTTDPKFGEAVEYDRFLKENLRCAVLKGPNSEIWVKRNGGDHQSPMVRKPCRRLAWCTPPWFF